MYKNSEQVRYTRIDSSISRHYMIIKPYLRMPIISVAFKLNYQFRKSELNASIRLLDNVDHYFNIHVLLLFEHGCFMSIRFERNYELQVGMMF